MIRIATCCYALLFASLIGLAAEVGKTAKVRPLTANSKSTQKQVDDLKARFQQAEREAARIASQIRRQSDNSNPRSVELLQDELKASVKSAFDLRAALQQAQLDAAMRDLELVQQRLAQRQQRSERIIQRRMEELQGGADLSWSTDDRPDGIKPKSKPKSSAVEETSSPASAADQPPIGASLQQFGLEELAVVAIWQLDSDGYRAMILTPDHQRITVRVGDPVGHRGNVLAITNASVFVREVTVTAEATLQKDKRLDLGAGLKAGQRQAGPATISDDADDQVLNATARILFEAEAKLEQDLLKAELNKEESAGDEAKQQLLQDQLQKQVVKNKRHLYEEITKRIQELNLRQPRQVVVSDDGGIGAVIPVLSAAGITEIARMSRPDLKAVCSVVDSPDGKHLYAAARDAHKILVYGRQSDDGPPTKLLQTVLATDPNDLDGVLGLRVTPDGKYVVTTSFRAKTVTLFSRDAETGLLTRKHVARDGVDGVIGLHWAFDCEISADSKFVYVTNSVSGRGDSVLPAIGDGHITVFRISGDRLNWVETHTGRNDCFDGATHVAIHPTGKWLYTANSNSSAIVVLKRDSDSGRVTIQQIVRDNDLLCLDGVFSVVCSPDGNHLYASSGRFRGEHGVSVFRIARSDDLRSPGLQLGSISPLQVHRGGGGNLTDFGGGNRVIVSPDGSNVYVMASLTGILATFDRDATTGRLTNTQSLRLTPDDGSLGPASMHISADGKYIYAGAQDHSSVIVLSRE